MTIINAMGELAGIIAQFGVFFAGAWMAMTGRGASAGMIIAFVQMMNYVINPIAIIPSILAQRKAAFALIDNLASALNQNIRDEGTHIPSTLSTGIRMDNVSFSYDGEKNALENISTHFEVGKSYAIVGSSGSGKSTLLNLLMAGYSNYEGAIHFDDNELRNISSESLYELVSLIQQNVFVFNNTVRDNVTMFHPFDDEAVEKALTLSGLNEFIDRRGTDALCGENGCHLSGGEKQRISIARSLLRKSSVLLMDEATAALDTQTAFRVISSILDLEGLTRIVVTHALDESLLNTPGYCQKEFLSEEMPDALAVADIVLSRAGSNTLSELLALQKPMLLIPYPLSASRGDQVENAKSYAAQGLARVLMQEDMTAQTMTEGLINLLNEKNELLEALKAYPVKDGTDKVLELIQQAQK